MVALLIALVLGSSLAHGSSPSAASAGPPPRVAVMVLENRSYGEVIGNAHAPYLSSLARRGALATSYYAVTHPSLPNYIALTTGGHAGINTDCASCDTSAPGLWNQLEANKLTWRAYFEGIPSRVTSPFSKQSSYNRHYNPFVYTDTLVGNELTGSVTNFAALHRDLVKRTLPQFSWIAPSVLHDGHHHPLPAADRFAKRLVPKVVRALGPRGVLFILWDEGRFNDHRGMAGAGGGRVALMAVGPGAAQNRLVTTRANHYALLHTIETRLGLPPLGKASSAPVLTGLFRP